MQMQCIVPIDNLKDKLDDDLKKQKEKAEKTAKSLVASAVRKKQSTNNKEDKKKKKAQQQCQDEREALQMQVDVAQGELERMSQSEQDQAAVQDAIKKALEKCCLPDSLPLTVMSSSPAANSTARQKVMEETMKQAQARLALFEGGQTATKDSQKSNSQEHAIGPQAAIAVLRREGTLAGPKKSTKGAKKDDKTITASEMRKLGKHLLK